MAHKLMLRAQGQETPGPSIEVPCDIEELADALAKAVEVLVEMLNHSEAYLELAMEDPEPAIRAALAEYRKARGQ